MTRFEQMDQALRNLPGLIKSNFPAEMKLVLVGMADDIDKLRARIVALEKSSSPEFLSKDQANSSNP